MQSTMCSTIFSVERTSYWKSSSARTSFRPEEPGSSPKPTSSTPIYKYKFLDPEMFCFKLKAKILYLYSRPHPRDLARVNMKLRNQSRRMKWTRHRTWRYWNRNVIANQVLYHIKIQVLNHWEIRMKFDLDGETLLNSQIRHMKWTRHRTWRYWNRNFINKTIFAEICRLHR